MIVKAYDFDIYKIAESGQCFRLNEGTDHLFSVIHKGRYLTIRELDPSEESPDHDNKDPDKDPRCTYRYELSCDEKEYDEIWEDYFDMHLNYDTIACMIDKEDAFLNQAYEFGRGIRILNQDPWEMLISFIISQRKSIPAIKTSIEKLCRACGKKIGDTDMYSFPEPHEILSLSEEELGSCSLGYRTKYVMSAAEDVACGKLDLYGLREADDDTLRAELMKVYGVGLKVANCVMLFGYHRLDAFPEDVWIKRALESEYPSGFPYDRYAGYGGIMQQYIFYYMRNR